MFREETRYFKEVGMNEEITIDFKVVESSPKGERWQMSHDVYKKDGSLAATITLEGAWFDIDNRKLIAPPQELADLLNGLPKSDDYKEIK